MKYQKKPKQKAIENYLKILAALKLAAENQNLKEKEVKENERKC